MKCFHPAIGDHVEFLSDSLTDKGPCTGTVTAVEGGVQIACSDESIWIDPEEADVERITTHAKDGKKLYLLY